MSDFFKKMGTKFDALKKHKMNALANFNVPETPDEEFQAEAATFYAMKDGVITLVDSAEKFFQVMKQYTKALETITEGFGSTMTLETGGDGGANAGAPLCDAAAATQVVFDFSNRTQEHCVNFFTKTVLEPLQAKRDAIHEVDAAIKKRQKLKGEYDYYYEKVRKLREKKGDNAKNQEKVDRNEPKLEEAKVELLKASAPLIALFKECVALRTKIVAHEYENFKQCQKVFFATGVEKFETLAAADFPLVPLPPLSEDADVTALAASMKAATVESGGAAAAADDADAGGGAAPEAAEAGVAAEADASPAEPAGADASSADAGDDKPAATEAATPADGEGTRAVALFDFEPNDTDELKLVAGQELVVHVQNDGGWWEGEANGEVGLFPSSYVKLQQ